MCKKGGWKAALVEGVWFPPAFPAGTPLAAAAAAAVGTVLAVIKKKRREDRTSCRRRRRSKRGGGWERGWVMEDARVKGSPHVVAAAVVARVRARRGCLLLSRGV